MAPTDPSPSPSAWARPWRYARGLLAPLLVCALLVAAIQGPVRDWLRGPEHYDEEVLREWLRETRNPDRNLQEIVADYLEAIDQRARTLPTGEGGNGGLDDPAVLRRVRANNWVRIRRGEIGEHLRA